MIGDNGVWYVLDTDRKIWQRNVVGKWSLFEAKVTRPAVLLSLLFWLFVLLSVQISDKSLSIAINNRNCAFRVNQVRSHSATVSTTCGHACRICPSSDGRTKKANGGRWTSRCSARSSSHVRAFDLLTVRSTSHGDMLSWQWVRMARLALSHKTAVFLFSRSRESFSLSTRIVEKSVGSVVCVSFVGCVSVVCSRVSSSCVAA